MDYKYGEKYGTGDNSRWGKRQNDWDKAVNKGLAQNAKEERLPFQKLLAKLRHEAEVYACQARRFWVQTPAQRYGYGYKVEDGEGKIVFQGKPVNLGNYWFEQLGS